VTWQLLTPQEASERLGIPVYSVLYCLTKGYIKGHKVSDRLWRIPSADLDQYGGVPDTDLTKLVELRTKGWSLDGIHKELGVPIWRVHYLLTGHYPKPHTVKVNQRELNRFVAEKRKLLVITHYGHGRVACVRCGFSDMRALSIDHVDACGARNRRFTGQALYQHLIKSDYPEGYQTLCMNCQWIKRHENHEYGWQSTDGKKILGNKSLL